MNTVKKAVSVRRIVRLTYLPLGTMAEYSSADRLSNTQRLSDAFRPFFVRRVYSIKVWINFWVLAKGSNISIENWARFMLCSDFCIGSKFNVIFFDKEKITKMVYDHAMNM